MPAIMLAIMLGAAGQDALPRSRRLAGSNVTTPTESAVHCPAPARGKIVPFTGLPAEVLMDLRGIDPRVSPPDGPFNPTDSGEGPRTRMIAALRIGGRLAVAYERGGRGYGITVRTYEIQRWTGLMKAVGAMSVPVLDSAGAGAACQALERSLDQRSLQP